MGCLVSRVGLAVVLVSGLAATAAGAGMEKGDAAKSGSHAQSAPALTPAELVPTLHRINQMEIDAGKMAQDKGASQVVKDLGQTLERDHKAADDKLKDFADKSKLSMDAAVPSSVAGDLQRAKKELDDLKNVNGTNFDRRFATQMVRDHEKAIGIVSKARAADNDPQLQILLGELEPDLREHLELARNALNGRHASATETGQAVKARGRRGASTH